MHYLDADILLFQELTMGFKLLRNWQDHKFNIQGRTFL